MNTADFRSLIHEDIEQAVNVSGYSKDMEFLSYAAGLLINGEEFDDFTECHYEGISRRNGNMRIDGYASDETDGSCCLFISSFSGPNGEESVNAEDINAAFKKLRLFVAEAMDTELYRFIKAPAQAVDFARDIYYDNPKITKFRFYFVTDAYNKQRVKTLKSEIINGKPVDFNVWDIERLHDLASSSMHKEKVEIVFSDFGCDGIPCVKAVEYQDIKADIDVIPSEVTEGKPANIISYSSYLAVFPGSILNTLYLEYGSKLLEGNVRAFLSARGKVNKSIQGTIKYYPEMFFAYNNGIAATASGVETKMTPNGPVITKIENLQIVNGGQTTASIANTILTAKKDENINLDTLYVPMKLSVLEYEDAERIIPKISQYSNSQNKVNESDFFSNHPFHTRMADISVKTAIPQQGGRQYQQYWFYERTRGLYNQGKMKFGAKSSQLKHYTEKYPEEMVITMFDLAKYALLHSGSPDIVSKGKQKTIQKFSAAIKEKWDANDARYNANYYKKIAALAIIYNKTDEIIKQSDWYKETKSYKANVIAYTLSILFNYIRTNCKGYAFDFARIWNSQSTYEELDAQIDVLTREVYRFITGARPIENVTEWCKSNVCWEKAKNGIWSIDDDFIDTLISKQDESRENKEASAMQKVSTEVDDLKEAFARGSGYWSKVMDWGYSNKLITEKEASLLKLLINAGVTGRIPTDKQIKAIKETRARFVKNGMPLDF